MSGPNSSYDPVEVTPLRADQVEEMREQAFAAIAGATDLAALKQVRIDHTGDRSPLALANREIGALPPQAKKEAGQRVGQARGTDRSRAGARRPFVGPVPRGRGSAHLSAGGAVEGLPLQPRLYRVGDRALPG